MGVFTQALEKIVGGKERVEAHELLLLQAMSYRVTKEKFSALLKSHNLTLADWFLLGLLYNATEGSRSSYISEKLGVEPPFVTELIQKLLKAHLVSVGQDATDKRAKLIKLTPKGHRLIETLTRDCQPALAPILSRCSNADIQAYVRVMRSLCD